MQIYARYEGLQTRTAADGFRRAFDVIPATQLDVT